MGAKVICDNEGLPQAAAYYSLVGTIPVGKSESIKADKVANMGGKFTLQNLVKAILMKVSYGDDLCIVCHGARNRLGVITQGADTWLHHHELDALKRFDPNDFGVFGLDLGSYQKLLDDIFKVQALRINHLAVRACRIGNDRGFLKKLGCVFGANSVSAPTLKTAYLKPHYYDISKPASTAIFKTAFPSNFEVPLSTHTGKVLVGSFEYSRTQFKAGLAADTDAALGQFYHENFPGRLTPTKKQMEDSASGFPMHGLCVPGQSMKFYFPQDGRYLSALTYVSDCRY